MTKARGKIQNILLKCFYTTPPHTGHYVMDYDKAQEDIISHLNEVLDGLKEKHSCCDWDDGWNACLDKVKEKINKERAQND